MNICICRKSTAFVVCGFLLLGALLGCQNKQALPAKKAQGRAKERVAVRAGDTGAIVTVEITGIYYEADHEQVKETLQAMRDSGSGSFSAGWSGNRMTLELSPVGDVEAFAEKIKFGKVIEIDGRTIKLEYTQPGQAPALANTSIVNRPPEDELGPALEKHGKDLAIALRTIGADVSVGDDGKIVEIDMPAFKITDETLAQLANLTSLKVLDLNMNRHITDKGARHLQKLTNLEELKLFGTRVGNPGQRYLKNLTQLKLLSLSGIGTQDGLQFLSELKNVERLDIGYGRGYRVTEEGLSHLKGFTGLKNLRLDGCQVSDAGLAIIGEFKQMESLGLKHGSMTNDGLANIALLQNLRSLSLSGCKDVGELGLEHLPGLTNLTYLNLSDTRVTDDALDHLQAMTKISSLNLDGTQVTDEGIKRLAHLQQLRQLVLSNTAVTDTGIAGLSVFPKLDNVWLSKTGITDAALKTFGEMPDMRTLRLDETQITDAGLAELGKLAKLRTLDLSQTRVSDNGLKHLAGCEQLNDLRVEDTGISQEALRQFRARNKKDR